MDVLVWLALAAAASGLEWWRRRRAKARMRAVRAWARAQGLRYEYVDVSGLTDPTSQRLWRPFRLFGLGDRRGIENIVSGEFDGVPVELFDFWYEEDGDRRRRGWNQAIGVLGTTSTPTRRQRFTCAVANAPGAASWPHLSIAPEGFQRRLKAAAGFRDIEFESERFNRMFEVQAVDRKFAYDVLDARLMSWLLLTEGQYEIELRDQDVLLVADELPIEKWQQLALVAAGFIKRLPSTAVRRPTRDHARPDAPSVLDPPTRAPDDFDFFA